jgi:ATP-dependent DNA helicase RecQ
MQFLDRQGIISLSQEFSEKISLQFIIESKEVIRYMSLNPQDEEIILAILRTYPGIYETLTAFNLQLIAKKSNSAENQVLAVLKKLKEKYIIEYIAKNNDATIVFNEVREDELTINRVSKYLEKQNNLKKEQLKAVLNFIEEKKVCRSKLILDYFGEKTNTNCGICSYCIGLENKKSDTKTLAAIIIELLKIEDLNSREIQIRTKKNSSDILLTLQQLLEHDQIMVQPNNKYTIKS